MRPDQRDDLIGERLLISTITFEDLGDLFRADFRTFLAGLSGVDEFAAQDLPSGLELPFQIRDPFAERRLWFDIGGCRGLVLRLAVPGTHEINANKNDCHAKMR